MDFRHRSFQHHKEGGVVLGDAWVIEVDWRIPEVLHNLLMLNTELTHFFLDLMNQRVNRDILLGQRRVLHGLQFVQRMKVLANISFDLIIEHDHCLTVVIVEVSFQRGTGYSVLQHLIFCTLHHWDSD